MRPRHLLLLLLAAAFLPLTGCETTTGGVSPSIAAAIVNEAPGNYYIGRRYYKKDYKMWGWVRKPGQPWKTSRLVMLNENTKFAPDRERGTLGTDNNQEYRLEGYFADGQVYEPASNRFYPEFVLTAYSIISTAPQNIFKDRRALDPKVRLLTPPL